MIVVKIELWKGGNPNDVEEIGRTFIWNTGEGSYDRGDYGVAVLKKGYDPETAKGPVLAKDHVYRRGEVFNYPRLSYNVWRLIIRALRSAFPEEQDEQSSL